MKRAHVAAIGSVLGLVGLVGVAHTPMGRPLLAWMGGAAGGCPVALARATPAALERGRVDATTPMRGEAKAPARSALGLTLMRSSRGDVDAWAKATGATCATELQGAALRCALPADASAVATSAMSDVLFRFDERATLVAIDAMTPAPDAAAAIARVDAASATVAATLGVDARRADATADALDEPLARASASYRYSDYVVELVASNMGPTGFVVREQYLALPD